MDKWLNNLKISNKLLVAPVIVLGFLIAFFVVGLWGLNSQKSSLNAIFNEDFQNAVKVDDYLNTITELQGNIYKYITWARANYSQSRLDEITNYQNAQLEKTVKSLTELSALNSVPDDQKVLIKKALAEFKDYKQAVASFFDLAGFDLNTATMAVSTVEEKHAALLTTITQIHNKTMQNSQISFDSASRNYSMAVTVFVIFLIASISLSLLAIFRINRAIIKPLVNLNEAAQKVSGGNYDVNIQTMSDDEIGRLTSVFKEMVENIKSSSEILLVEKNSVEQKVNEAVRTIEEQKQYLSSSVNSILSAMGKFAEGDLTVNLTIEKEDEIGKLFEGFNQAVKNVHNLISSVTQAAEAVASASGQISSSSEQMASGASEQSAQTVEVVTAVEEMAKTIIELTKNSSRAADASQNAGSIAKEGGRVVDATIDGMNEVARVVKQSSEKVHTLGMNSDKIGEIVQVIDDIADQTNLLALNAAIEAARAGEQGRGFAVVADEVRKLAERTTKATKEIADMIRQIQKDTQDAVISMQKGTEEVEKGKLLADKAGNSLQQIIKGADEVAGMALFIASASEEQSSAAEQISRNIDAISNVTRESASGLQQIARASEDLNRLTINLQELISRFNLGSQPNKLTGHKRILIS